MPHSRQAQVRAALIALVIALNALVAIPEPARVRPALLDSPNARDELAAWLELTDTLGLDWTEDDLRELVLASANGWFEVRRTLIGGPTRPMRRYLGIRQSWALFARPDTRPTHLVISGRAGDGTWTELYRSLDPEHRLLAPQVRYRRMRGVLDGAARPHPAYANLCRHLAGLAFDAHPELTELRFTMQEIHIAPPGTASLDRPRVLHGIAFERAEVRP